MSGSMDKKEIITINSKEVEIDNKSGCRLIALGGSTTAGVETKEPYPKILENLL